MCSFACARCLQRKQRRKKRGRRTMAKRTEREEAAVAVAVVAAKQTTERTSKTRTREQNSVLSHFSTQQSHRRRRRCPPPHQAPLSLSARPALSSSFLNRALARLAPRMPHACMQPLFLQALRCAHTALSEFHHTSMRAATQAAREQRRTQSCATRFMRCARELKVHFHR